MLNEPCEVFNLGPQIKVSPMGRSIAGEDRWCVQNGIILRTRHDTKVFPQNINKVEDLFEDEKPVWFRVTHGFFYPRIAGSALWRKNPNAVPAILHNRRLPRHPRYTFCVELSFDDLITLMLSC